MPFFYNFPALCLFLLLFALSVSLVYPQNAFPLHAVGIAAVLLASFGAICGHHVWRRWKDGGDKLAAAASLLAMAWPAWWLLRQGSAPVPELSRATLATHFQGALVFLASMSLMITWPRRDMEATGAGQPTEAPKAISPDRLVAMWIAFGCALMALYGVYQVLGPEGLPRTFRTQAAEIRANSEAFSPQEFQGILHALDVDRRAVGTLGSPNIFAGLLVLALPVIAGLIAAASCIRGRVAGLLAMVVCAAGIWLSGSRGGIVGGGISLLFFGFFGLVVRRRRGAAAVVPLLLMLLLVTGARQPGEGSRWFGITTLQQRAYYWESATDIWSQNWLMGVGPGGFEALYTQHRVAGAQETVYAHDWFLQWGCEVGGVGVLLFTLWAVCVLLLAWRWLRREGGWLAAALAASFTGALIHGLVEYTMSFREVYLVMALAAGTAAGMGARLASSSPATASETGRSPARVALFVIFLVTSAGAWWFFGVRPAAAAYHDSVAISLLLSEGPGAATRDAYSRAIQWQPDSPALYEARGNVREQTGDPAAIDDFQRALALQPQSARLHQTLAMYQLRRGRLEQAIELQEKAVSLHPLDGTHRLVLADLLSRAGRKEEAVAMTKTLDGLLLDEQEKAMRSNIESALSREPLPTK